MCTFNIEQLAMEPNSDAVVCIGDSKMYPIRDNANRSLLIPRIASKLVDTSVALPTPRKVF
jgi:hypothetical protein